MDKPSKIGVVLFSGGVDSTYIVTRIISGLDRLILLTYKVPGMIQVERSRKSARQLIKIYGDKISHEIIDIRDFVNYTRGGIVKRIQDNLKYRFLYSWCLGCKASMQLFTINYCEERNIKLAFDGSNYYDAHALEQHEDVKQLLTTIYKTAGIEFICPSYYQMGNDSAITPFLVKTIPRE